MLTEDARLLKKYESVLDEISKFQLQQRIKDDLIDYFLNNKNVDSKTAEKYVFSRIPYTKSSIIQHLRKYAELSQQRKEVANQIN